MKYMHKCARIGCSQEGKTVCQFDGQHYDLCKKHLKEVGACSGCGLFSNHLDDCAVQLREDRRIKIKFPKREALSKSE